MNAKDKIINKKLLFGIYIVIAILLIIVSIGYYSFEEKRIINEKYQDLHAISTIKVDQINHWQDERTENVKINSKSPFLTNSIQSWLKNKSDTSLQRNILQILSLAKNRFNLENIYLFSLHNEQYFESDENALKIDESIKDKIDSTRLRNKITFTGFYNCTIQNKLHYDIIAPVTDNNNQVVAILFYCINLNEFLKDFINSNISNESTSEVLVICKKDSVSYYINHPISSSNKVESKCMPINKDDEIANAAISGFTGMLKGKDYKGQKVLCDICSVPKTKLILITKIKY